MTTKPGAWSYSSVTMFDLCPKKYKYKFVDKHKEPETEILRYGNEVHKAIEQNIKIGTPLPEKFAQFTPYVEKMKSLPGDKLAEHKLGLRLEGGKIVPCGFFDKDIWFRCVIDILILDNEKERAVVGDWKTGSNKYPDDRQLELMASATFLHFPHIKTIKAGLIFLVANDLIKREYDAKHKLTVFSELDNILTRRQVAYETGVFNPKQNFTCKKFCPVMDCAHNGRR